jgi:hypothetical protein
MNTLDERTELLLAIGLDMKRLNASKAMFELAVYEGEPDTAQRWFTRYSKTLTSYNIRIELLKTL